MASAVTVLTKTRLRVGVLRQRGAALRLLAGDAVAAEFAAACARQGFRGMRFLLEAARSILARELTVRRHGKRQPIVLVPRRSGDEIDILAVPKGGAVALDLGRDGREGLGDTRADRRDTSDRYRLPNPPGWLAAYPDLVNFAFLSAAARYPDIAPLLYDRQRRGTGGPPAPRLGARMPAQARLRSVLFFGHCYYNFKHLAAALRERGWDAVVASPHPSDGLDSWLYHGEDISLYHPNRAEFRKGLQRFFSAAGERFGIVHMYGVGTLSLFPWNWDTEATHAAIPWDILEWRRRGILVGYTPTGCLDGVAQSAFAAWSPTTCARCAWRDRPDICSDAKNLAWGRKRNVFVDLISLDCGPALDFNSSEKAFRGPLTAALDPAFWHPDLEPPEHLRRERSRDDEIIVYHGVGNYALRTREGVNVKGTHAVVAAIEALRDEGIPIRLDFVENVPSIDNRFVQVQADIIVDQLNHGRYGATAREGMMLGKPVVARINRWDGDGVPATRCVLETPVVNADETTIKGVLRELALDPARRAALGRASREHALKWCAASSLAERFERVYDIVRETGRPPRSLD